MLLGWEDCKRFGILHPTWPEPFDRARAARQPPDTCEEVVERLKEEFSDILADVLPPTPMKGEPMKIRLTEDVEVVPKKTFIARKLPLHQEEEAKRLIAELKEKKVITEQTEATEWVSPGFFVPKPNGKLRLVTDYTHLNRYLKRPVHPFPSAKEMMQGVKPESRFFIKLDAVSGYWQMPVAEEDQHYTTFLLPSGRYKYLRGPMGMAPTSDEWNIRSDKTIEGLDWAEKIVDDTLVQAPTVEALYQRAREVLRRCREHGITISLKKLQAGKDIPFAGYLVGQGGIRPDPERTRAINDMVVEHSIPGVRSFLGLANQLGQFVPDLAQNTNALRSLLKKDNAFIWREEHDEEVAKVKEILTAPGILKPFDPTLPTEILTDAARIHGMGFILLQREGDGSPRLITCGSTSMTGAQTRYAVIETEMLALTWAIEKCEFYLKGIKSFKAVTDHKPLVGIFAKDINEIRNPRLQRMRMRIMQYSFDIEWKAGKTHLIADALSRAPVFKVDAEAGSDAGQWEEVCRRAVTIIARDKGGILCNDLLDEAARDREYMQMVHEVRRIESFDKLSPSSPARQLKHVWGRISFQGNPDGAALMMVDGLRVVIPEAARKKVVMALHKGHCGMEKTKQQARQLFWWPGMMNEVEIACANCPACIRHKPSLVREPMTPPPTAFAPMSHVGADLFDYKGQPWLVMVDRFSGWPFVAKMRGSDTASVCKQLSSWFNMFGWATAIRTDGGPAFRLKFSTFCRTHGMTHELSSAYSAQSNGLAEAGVKATKGLLAKVTESGEDYEEAIAAYRNTPRADGYSPAQMMLGRRMKGGLPMLREHLMINSNNFVAGKEERDKTLKKTIAKYDENKIKLEKLEEGQKVIVQCQHTKKWNKYATVISVRRSGHSYNLEDDDGFSFIRNRRFIKIRRDEDIPEEGVVAAAAADAAAAAEAPAGPRRSSRIAEKCSLIRAVSGDTSTWAIAATRRRSLRPLQGPGWSPTTASSMSREVSTCWKSTNRQPGACAAPYVELGAAVASPVGSARPWRIATSTDWHVQYAHQQAQGNIREPRGTGMPFMMTTPATAAGARCINSTATGSRKFRHWTRRLRGRGADPSNPTTQGCHTNSQWCTSHDSSSSRGNGRRRLPCQAQPSCDEGGEQCAVRAVKKPSFKLVDKFYVLKQEEDI
jgi:hypothetical protein